MYCSKCGNELRADSDFCNKCGEPVERINIAPEMSLEESITYVEKLKTKYSKIEKLGREIADNESVIARPVRQNSGQYSFFRFFWKYLIWAVVAFYATLLLVLFAGNNSTAIDIILALVFIAPIVVLIVGAVLAAKRRNEENEAIYQGNERALEQREELKRKTESLKKDFNALEREIEKYEYAVPRSLRKSSSMNQILTLLKSGKASDLNDAYRLLGK